MTLKKKRSEPYTPQKPAVASDAKKHYAVPHAPAAPGDAEKHHPAPRAPELRHDREHERDSGCEREQERREEGRASKIVERTWFYGRGEECEERHEHDHDDDRHRHHECRGDDDGGFGRPTRPPGVSTGRLGQGGPLTTGDINAPNIPGVWCGPRSDMDLPYLFLRANPADLGARPVVGAPFWESPDIFILAGVTPALAPALPPALGQVALAGQPNTIYAHVWNFGKAAANEIVVEFYWVDPSLGISPGSVHLIAQTFTSLGAKGSGHSHSVVKCPEAWTPTFLNGGHECLLVRVWDNPADLPGEPKFDASINRHVGQRNIHVVGPGPRPLGADVAAPTPGQPLVLKVGPLYGTPASVAVERVSPNNVPWLQLHTGKRGVFPAMAAPTGVPTLSPPTTAGGGFPTAGDAAQQDVHGDDQQVALSTSDDPPGPGEAHVYRVSAKQGGAIFGGYTVVILG